MELAQFHFDVTDFGTPVTAVLIYSVMDSAYDAAPAASYGTAMAAFPSSTRTGGGEANG